MAGKEKVRDWETSKESENNQLAKRVGKKLAGQEQKKVKNGSLNYRSQPSGS